jgi:hypothetical protein
MSYTEYMFPYNEVTEKTVLDYIDRATEEQKNFSCLLHPNSDVEYRYGIHDVDADIQIILFLCASQPTLGIANDPLWQRAYSYEIPSDHHGRMLKMYLEDYNAIFYEKKQVENKQEKLEKIKAKANGIIEKSENVFTSTGLQSLERLRGRKMPLTETLREWFGGKTVEMALEIARTMPIAPFSDSAGYNPIEEVYTHSMRKVAAYYTLAEIITANDFLYTARKHTSNGN